MKKFFFLILVSIFLLEYTFAVEITYYGHSCFKFTFGNSFSIIIDPFSSDYPIPKTQANLIISSHEHEDHYNPNFLGKKVETLVGTKNNGRDWNLFDKKIADIKIYNIPSYHDNLKGAQRGKNSIIVIEAEGLKLTHMGDIGHLLTKNELNKLKDVDILFIPVGGFYTIDVKDVVNLIKDLKPKIVIPMHYKTEYTIDWPISPLDNFLKEIKTYYKIVEIKTNHIEIIKEKLPKETEIWILNYK